MFLFTAIVESDDLRAVINEMDKAFNYSQKVSFSFVLFNAYLRALAIIITLWHQWWMQGVVKGKGAGSRLASVTRIEAKTCSTITGLLFFHHKKRGMVGERPSNRPATVISSRRPNLCY